MSGVQRPLSDRTGFPDRIAVPEYRSGQGIGDGFVAALVSSATNLTQQPVYLVLATVSIFTGFSASVGAISIFTILYRILSSKVATAGKIAFLYKFLASVFFTLDYYVLSFSCVAILSIALLCKPSRKNFLMFVVFIFMLLLFSDTASFPEALISGVFFYFYTQLRDPRHKLVVFGIYIALMSIVLAASELVKIDASYSLNNTEKDEEVIERLMGSKPSFQFSRRSKSRGEIPVTGRGSGYVPNSFGSAASEPVTTTETTTTSTSKPTTTTGRRV